MLPRSPSPAPLFAFDNTYVRDLPDYGARWQPEAASKPRFAALNRSLAHALGLDEERLAGDEGLAVFSGQVVPPGAEPFAQAYAGHQFGGFSPRLGDGRAVLLGEVIDRAGQRRDLAFKGSGRTPFSRNGDGKCALGPALREYIIGEAMHALGIPTTRVLAVVATGDMVRRERALPGAVLTRVAASHLRVGTFEFFAAHRGPDWVKKLADYAIARHDPALIDQDGRYAALLDAVCRRQAELVARWLGVGFIHGVMNTDNMTLSGETIDYGPCAFMEAYDPATVFSSIDTHGRYAYGNQADIAQWNLARFAETLLPLIDPDQKQAVERATARIVAFPAELDAAWLRVMRQKLGLSENTASATVDRRLIDDFLDLLHHRQCDFTLAFHALTETAAGNPHAFSRMFAANDAEATAWRTAWEGQRDPALLDAMRRANPWLIARNHQVEAALEAATERFDLAPTERLVAALRAPFTLDPALARYAEPAPAEVTAAYRTFCGT